MKIPTYIGFNPDTKKFFDETGQPKTGGDLAPDIMIGQQKLYNLDLKTVNEDGELVNYAKIPTGATFEIIVENDYSNPTFSDFDNTSWTNIVGNEYQYTIALTAKPFEIYENNGLMAEGTAGSLAVSEWAWDIGTLKVTVRLSDDTSPTSKASGYIQYVESNFTKAFIQVQNPAFNLTNTWYDLTAKTFRDPVSENGEITYEADAGTEDFIDRLGSEAQITNTNTQLDIKEPGTGESMDIILFQFVCRNKYLANPLSPTETTVNVYTKAEIDAQMNGKVDKDLSGYTSKGTLDGTETIYIDDNGTPKATPSSSLLNVPSNQITGTGTINIRTNGQFPTNYTNGLIYTIGSGVTALTDGITTLNVNEQSTAIIINKDVTKASIVITTDINQITKQNLNPSIDTVQFNPSISAPSHSEGLIYYDSANKAMAFFNDESDVTLQIGQEIWVRVYNDTGVQIDNGKACYLSGVFSGFPTIALAQSDSVSTSLATIGIATHNIGIASFGYVTRLGTVRGLDTSACSSGDILYLSASSAGDFTTTQPDTPNYLIVLGNCGVSDVSVGTIEINISVGNNYNDVIEFYNGSTLDSEDVTITSNGTIVTLSVEKSGGGDLVVFFNGNPEIFVAAPATIVLTHGTDEIPTRNFVYIPESTKVLTIDTSGFPTDEQFIPITDSLVPSAATVQSFGVYKCHNWTDHLSSPIGTGHLSHLNKWIRSQHATYVSGVLPSFTGSGTATVEMSSTAGLVLQLHEHLFPVFASPAPFFVFNDSVSANDRITNIASLTLDSTGSSLLGGTYALVIWGVVNENESDCKYFINLPSGSYGAGKPDDTRADADGYTNFSIPTEYKGVGFLVHRLVISANVGGTVFTVYTDSSDDLRGFLPNTSAGATTGGGAGTGDMLAATYDPAGIGEQLAGLTASQTLTNKTITSPVINASVSGTAILDEDDLSSDSNTQLATQQSIKAYVDSSAGTPEITNSLVTTATVNITVLDTTTSTSSGQVDFRIYDATSGFELAKLTTVFDTENFTSPVGGSSYAPSDFTFATDTSGNNIRFNITNNTANTVNYGYRILNSSTA